jgi:MSHA biogenesis protein MshJ
VKLWQRYLAWFAALKPRERNIVAVAVVLGGMFVGYTYAIEPKLLQAKRDTRAITEATTSAATMRQQTTALQMGNRDPDAPLRAQLAALKAEFAAQGGRVAAVEKSLVPAEKMSGLLENFLARGNNLQLISLRTLEAKPLVTHKPKPAGNDKSLPAVGAAADAAAAALEGAPNLFKHGVEIKIAGPYHELLTYVRALENAPQRLLWGKMDLMAEEYPRSQLTLTVYTLSLDKSWLVL